MKYLKAYGDLILIVNQVKVKYEVSKEDLIPNHQVTISRVDRFKGFYIYQVSHKDNMHVDALTSLTVTLALPPKIE